LWNGNVIKDYDRRRLDQGLLPSAPLDIE